MNEWSNGALSVCDVCNGSMRLQITLLTTRITCRLLSSWTNKFLFEQASGMKPQASEADRNKTLNETMLTAGYMNNNSVPQKFPSTLAWPQSAKVRCTFFFRSLLLLGNTVLMMSVLHIWVFGTCNECCKSKLLLGSKNKQSDGTLSMRLCKLFWEDQVRWAKRDRSYPSAATKTQYWAVRWSLGFKRWSLMIQPHESCRCLQLWALTFANGDCCPSCIKTNQPFKSKFS